MYSYEAVIITQFIYNSWPKGPPSGAQYSSWERKGNPWVDFLMVIIASGFARGRVRMTMAVESPNMLAILQKRGWQTQAALVYCVLLWYWTSMLGSIDTCQNSVSQGHIMGSSLQLIEVTCFFEVDCSSIAGFLIGSRSHVGLTSWTQGRIVLKPDLSLKFNRIMPFSSIKMLFVVFFCVYGDCYNWKQKLKRYTEKLTAKLQNSN